jgi:hypothetical protein
MGVKYRLFKKARTASGEIACDVFVNPRISENRIVASWKVGFRSPDELFSSL